MANLAFAASHPLPRPFVMNLAAVSLQPFKALRRWLAGRTTERQLNALDDNQLKDIGIVRGEISEIAFGNLLLR